MRKNGLRLLCLGMAMAVAAGVSAADCELLMSTIPVEQGEDVPESISSRLMSKLRTAMSQYGVVASDGETQFFVTGRFDNSYLDVTSAGTQRNYMVKTTLKVYIGDMFNKKEFASAEFQLKGVGKTLERAYSRALSSLGNDNIELVGFIEEGKSKIIDYFNKNYTTYLNRARTALKAREYGEAFYYAVSVPECCKGYSEALDLVNTIYLDKINYEGKMLLAQARGEWAADPTATGASAAYDYLVQIDPSASCYSEAVSFGKDIQKFVRADWEFENKEKYRDEVELEKKRIDAAREIGVAWANNQPKENTKIYWLY